MDELENTLPIANPTLFSFYICNPVPTFSFEI